MLGRSTLGFYTWTGLTNGMTYTFTHVAFNEAGGGPVATAEATPSGTPGRPHNVVAERCDGQVSLRWEAPDSDGGATVTAYRVNLGPDDTDVAAEPRQ